jgi:flagellar FliL protein
MTDTGDETELGTPTAPSGGVSSILLGLNLLLGVVGAGGVGWLVFAGGAVSAGASDADSPPVVHKLEPIIVNLNEPTSSRYLRIALELEAHGQAAADQLVARERAVKHALLEYLSGLTVEQTLGTESRERIRAALQEIFDAEIGRDKVLAVYVTEFVVQ